MQEIWKHIKGYEGSYQVSNLGRVKRIERLIVRSNGVPCTYREKIMSLSDNGGGYLSFMVTVDKKSVRQYIHRAVAEAFIPAITGKNQVNHIAPDKSDNRALNLEWCTAKENIHHAHDNGLMDSRQRKGVYCVNDGCLFKYSIDAARYYGVDDSSVVAICRGKANSTKGLVFCYKKDFNKIANREQHVKDAIKRSKTSSGKPVYCMTNSTEYESIAQAAKELELHASNIGANIRGRISQTGGYVFRKGEKY